MKQNDTRLQIKAKTVKKLFAYSGNQCAFKDCSAFLVDEGGTMVGKIAHIRSPKPRGPRYERSRSSEQCRDDDNLMVLCGLHHDIVDDPDREKEFPASLLEGWKHEHEARFKRAERALLAKYSDSTAAIEPTFPRNLRGLAAVLREKEMANCREDIDGIRLFATQLAAVPHDVRGFAYELTKRMRRLSKTELLTSDVQRAFNLTTRQLKEIVDILEEHQIGEAKTDWEDRWVVTITNREPHRIGLPANCNPFDEIIDYCEVSGIDSSRFLEDLDFALYDVVPSRKSMRRR